LREERETFDLIERYLQGNLNGEELAQVENRIKHDPSFAGEVQISAQVNSVVVGAAMDQLREKMTNDISTLDKKNKFKWWTGSFVVFLALTSSVYLYLKKDQPSERILRPESGKSSVISSGAISNDEKQKDILRPSGEIKKNNNGAKVEQPEEKKESILNTNENSLAIPERDIEKDIKNHDPVEQSNVSNRNIEDKKHSNENNMTPGQEKCKLSFRPVVHATCRGEATGSIEIDPESIEGGKAPYTFMIDHTGIESGSGYFRSLAEGPHFIIVKDKLGCSASQDVNIPDKHCQVKKSFAINPDNGEIWKVPYAEGESGKFTIINKAGIVIFKGTFGNGELSEWNGTDMNGITVNAGLYVCLLEYPASKTENLQITIIR
jgi:hypothetical protein